MPIIQMECLNLSHVFWISQINGQLFSDVLALVTSKQNAIG